MLVRDYVDGRWIRWIVDYDADYGRLMHGRIGDSGL